MKRGATPAGFHFLELFKVCKRKFYLTHVKHITPAQKAYMLIFGGAFHDAKAKYYKSKGDLDAAIASFKAALSRDAKIMEEPDKWLPFLAERGPIMLARWAEVFGRNDLANYRVMAIEKVLKVTLPNGMRITVKPDAVVRSSSGAVYLMETKTSFYSGNLQEESVALGDQATMYLYAYHKAAGKAAAGVVPDIIYWNRNSRKTSDIECSRGRLVTRTASELMDFEQGLMGDFTDLSARTAAVKRYPISQLFPRTTSWCLSYNRKCEYAEICRWDERALKALPPQYKREGGTK
jgi:PD-(D/E)XK nuclease superfamily